ncbi:DNA topoisomerase 4 subunit B [Candidatus Filomicrobium marinum]|uniref:DNA topoisomerase 4 subunit B n=2 Tax=Filomicrobium TaxID=119044 RepID=A0A0D6JBE4_9HYPH|nr:MULTISPECIES: DNA topoisomerase IV subunit B [Filomicrobium]MCV0368612.1 DNA topoisomerase IV subunit B [Filomicrobium sp.]CFX00957.1 DNA topoisomerase 4 subunit B [Candidatus Filomicrobium marinum]CPR15360.1 DNA topoisomerase 4 subunit B [Candidatus Filomicrobium marinum]SDO66468.1 DNA topoisomerase IV subunit B [Filomicrobium insigne]
MAKPQTIDLFSSSETELKEKQPRGRKSTDASDNYTAADIEVLEGLEPVRRRPGMYIGGTDEKALHHLFAEIIDNSMDEAVAGHASYIEVNLGADGYLTVADNGRGIPVDAHPKFKSKSALEVIMTTLHAGGKFDGKAYQTSGGLHGVGVSVVNALSEILEVEVARGQQLYRMVFSRGKPQSKLEKLGAIKNRRGTRVRFKPDEQIFGKGTAFKPARLFKMARSKAYLFGGVEIRWSCDPELIKDDTPAQAVFHFPGGLRDYLQETINGLTLVTNELFAGRIEKPGGHGSVEWALAWIGNADGFMNSYCNTIPTGEGGTHEAGLRAALMKGLRAYGDRVGNKKAAQITADDVMVTAGCMLSVFIREPEFQGQTKDKLATQEASRIVETTVRDSFDHWLVDRPQQANKLLEWVIEQAEERLKRRRDKEVSRQSATRKLRLPGKLADCTIRSAEGTEIFIVEGDSAGGSAKSARNRETQAILPLRGKILNVANASAAKLAQNQLLSDLIQALGVGLGKHYRDDDLRYERVIIMTDADVDGAHIASLLITFFFQQMPELITKGHLFLAVPPLFKLTHGAKSVYARDEDHKNALLKSEFKAGAKVEISRFKGLGEMNSGQLKETTMDPKVRTLLRVVIDDESNEIVSEAVNALMGSKPEARFRFIQDRAAFVTDLDV